ncbi:hypothetical protein IV203_031020 [Nitzschia inconspicua]|uniref:Uncharacterized protein n=1 Tax=Nitzschia inconspicua TaxID=303405 RepID=A0A9K3Q1S4_9STRA|nr:hypothetical protein IV203_031020 [Nitzschia inconspicua]
MSQPSYPSEINPRASDEASNNRDVSYWLGPNEAAAALFELKKSDSKRCSNHVWNFYHRVKRAKTDVPDKQLPYKWLQNSNKKSFMSCNGCDCFLTEAEHPHPLVEILKNAGGGAMEQTFLGSVQRGARDRQVGVHPAFSIPSFLDPRSKNKVPDLGAVYERVRAILNEQETKKRQSQGHEAGSIDAAAVTSTSNTDILDWGKEDDFFAELEADHAMGEQEAEIAVAVGVGGSTVVNC